MCVPHHYVLVDGDSVSIGLGDEVSVFIDKDGMVRVETPSSSMSFFRPGRIHLYVGYGDLVYFSEIVLSFILLYTIYMYATNIYIGLFSLYSFVLSTIYFTSFRYVYSIPMWVPVVLRSLSGFLTGSFYYPVGILVGLSWILYVVSPCKYSAFIEDVDKNDAPKLSLIDIVSSIIPLVAGIVAASVPLPVSTNISVLSTYSYSLYIPVYYLLIIDSDRDPGIDYSGLLLVLNTFIGLIESIIVSIYYLIVKRDKEFVATILLIILGLVPFISSIPFFKIKKPDPPQECTTITVDPPVFRLVRSTKTITTGNETYKVYYVIDPELFGYKYSPLLMKNGAFYKCVSKTLIKKDLESKNR